MAGRDCAASGRVTRTVIGWFIQFSSLKQPRVETNPPAFKGLMMSCFLSLLLPPGTLGLVRGSVPHAATASTSYSRHVAAVDVSMDAFAVLGLQRSTSVEALRAVYRERAKQCHPDCNPSEVALEEFHRITKVCGPLITRLRALLSMDAHAGQAFEELTEVCGEQLLPVEPMTPPTFGGIRRKNVRRHKGRWAEYTSPCSSPASSENGADQPQQTLNALPSAPPELSSGGMGDAELLKVQLVEKEATLAATLAEHAAVVEAAVAAARAAAWVEAEMERVAAVEVAVAATRVEMEAKCAAALEVTRAEAEMVREAAVEAAVAALRATPQGSAVTVEAGERRSAFNQIARSPPATLPRKQRNSFTHRGPSKQQTSLATSFRNEQCGDHDDNVSILGGRRGAPRGVCSDAPGIRMPLAGSLLTTPEMSGCGLEDFYNPPQLRS